MCSWPRTWSLMASRSTSSIVTELKPDVFVQVSMIVGAEMIKVVETAEADADTGVLA